jgi:hypothetical protein
LLGITACRSEKVFDLTCETAKSAKSEALERAAGDIKTAWEKNYGDEKDNCAQDGTHCPKDGTEGGARYSQDGTKGGARYSQDGTKGGACYSQDGTKGGAHCPQDGAKVQLTPRLDRRRAGAGRVCLIEFRIACFVADPPQRSPRYSFQILPPGPLAPKNFSLLFCLRSRRKRTSQRPDGRKDL